MSDLNYSDPEYIEAMSHNLAGDWEQAEAAFTKLAAKYPETSVIPLILGNIHYSLGNLETAVDHYNAAISRRDNYGVAYYKLGVCYYRMGRLQKALEAFESVLSATSNGKGSHAMASYFVGLISQFLGNDERAVEAFDAFRRSSKDSLIANFYLAQLQIKRKEFANAKPLLEELVAATPDFAEVHYMLGSVHYGLAENVEAIHCFRRALDLDPQDERARTKLGLLTEVQWP